ncbi:hypothetical protein D3C80_1778970 [compost metagenome]
MDIAPPVVTCDTPGTLLKASTILVAPLCVMVFLDTTSIGVLFFEFFPKIGEPVTTTSLASITETSISKLRVVVVEISTDCVMVL